MHVVRLATVADAEALGRLHVDVWRATYRGMMPDEFLDGLDPVQRADGWRDFLRSDSPATAWVVELDGEVVGWSNAGPPHDTDLGSNVGELWAINVAPAAWGLGLGRALTDTVLDALRDGGYEHAVLWVVDRNERARRFYEAGGWRTDGATKTDTFGGGAITEVRYRRPLGNPTSIGHVQRT